MHSRPRWSSRLFLIFSCFGLSASSLLAAAPAAPDAKPDFAGYQALVVSHTHSDFAWADSIQGCLDRNVAAVAKSVELAERYPDFRFCMEHMLAVREYLRRSPDKLEAVRKLMREGRFEAGGFFTGPWELTSGPEALVRQLYFGKLWVKQTLGIDPKVVWNVDVAGHTAQLPQILAKAGIQGFVISSGSVGPELLRWQARDGSSVLTWRTPWWYSASDRIGLRDKELTRAIATMPKFMADVARNFEEYGLPKVAFIADGSDIQSPTEQVIQNIRRWNDEQRQPVLTYSSAEAAFALVHDASVPSATGEMPSPWDRVQAQGTECFMPDRHLDGRLLSAEKLAAFCSVLDPAYAYPRHALDDAWWNRLYVFDHNWGGTHGQESDQIKAGMIQKAARLTDEALHGAFDALSGAIRFQKPTPTAVPLVIFNPLSWDRTDVVTCHLPAELQNASAVELVDSGGSVACQLVAAGPAKTGRLLVFTAKVPALGYATYYLSSAAEPKPVSTPFKVDAASHRFANDFFRLEFDPASGAIRSLIDQRSGRELVRSNSAYGFNELVAFEDTDEDIGMHLTGKRWLAREQPSTIRVLENGPVRLVIEVSGRFLDGSARRQQIVLYSTLPKIDFVTTLDWEGKRNMQVYQEFPLAVEDPVVRYAVPYGWEEYGQEMKYSAPWFSHDIKTVADLRWRGVRGWVELAEGGHNVALASDCNYAAFKDLAQDPAPGFLVQPLLLRTVRSCGGTHFFYEQKGEHTFRFALQPDGDASRLGEEFDAPLLSSFAENRAGAPATRAKLPERLSFLRSRTDSVHVAVVKKAEDGAGLVVRVVEMKERTHSTNAQLEFFRPLTGAVQTSLLEENQAPLKPTGHQVGLTLAPAGIETLRVRF